VPLPRVKSGKSSAQQESSDEMIDRLILCAVGELFQCRDAIGIVGLDQQERNACPLDDGPWSLSA
jgi:hypothetical protein